MDSVFDKIRPFYDHEVQDALQSIMHDPMMKAIMHFTFPNMTEGEWMEKLKHIHSTDEFQINIVYQALQQVLAKSSEGLTSSGFEKLDKYTAYLFISNHRDIILDTSLLNLTLCDYGLMLTASAIGDNLVKKPFLYTLSKINRNFLVQRGLPPRELLQSSKLMSDYIHQLLTVENRSVWLAQREGRTKDGNDATHPGVLKMLSLAAGKEDLVAFFKKLKIVPISISYEYDPTDSLKLPELLANMKNEVYVKGENEDFNSLKNGIMGQKKRIHIHAGDILNTELDVLAETPNANQQVKALAQIIDTAIIANYTLWSPNYIAYDLLHKIPQYAAYYTAEEKEIFTQRLVSKVDMQDHESVERFLAMYANPVVNKMGDERGETV